MSIEHFTREEFERALPLNGALGRLWVHGDFPKWQLGAYGPPETKVVDKGEFIYSVPVLGTELYIMVRSSVKDDEHSAGCGEYSIRLWLMSPSGPVASKLTKYITRVKGWERRLTTQLRTLYKIGLALKPCPQCGELRHAFIAGKTGKGRESTAQPQNVGRVFQKCVRPNARGFKLHGCAGSFEWVEFKDDNSNGKPTPIYPVKTP